MLARFQAIPSLHQHFPQLFTLLEQIFPIDQKLAVAVSGGSDSMLLSFLLMSFWEEQQWDKNQLFFLHCNHQVRKESKEEAIFLESFFQDLNFQFFIREKNGPATEEQLRKWRYSCFFKFCKEQQIGYLVLGHNLTDRIETSLMNMIRGCGIQGFVNMESLDDHYLLEKIKVVRPLLGLSKENIEGICKEFGIPFVEDQSNFDVATSLRNKIRNDFLFPLSELGTKKNGQSSFFESRKLVYQQLEKQEKTDPSKRLSPLKKNPYRNAEQAFERRIPKAILTKMEVYALFQLLEISTNKNELEQIVERLQNRSEGFRELGKWTIFLAHQQIFLIKGKSRFRKKSLQLEKNISEGGIQNFGAFQLEIPENLIGAKLRFPKTGDRYEGKLLGKWALNHKIPVFRRNALPLVEQDGKIIVVFRPEQLIF